MPPTVEKSSSKSLLWGIGSLVIFVVGFIVGVAALLGVGAGIMAVQTGKKEGKKAAIILGALGIILNGGWFLLVVLQNIQ